MTANATTTPPPETIPGDRFILLEKIGEGGTAIVWRARDREIGANVAIKILRSTDPDIQARFAQEVQVLANLHHANVVSALARGVTSRGAPYVALELVTGQSLRTRLEAGGPLPWREVVAIGVQLSGAVSALSSNGIVHRDLKPDNIMLTPEDSGVVVKLIDFGVARLADDWDPGADITPAPRPRTKLGLAVGTPGYMPPEAGYCPPDERFDVYGLAATLWEVGTGERVCGSPQAVAPCDLPEDLREVLLAALTADPDDRTQSAAELGRGLEAVLAAHPERGSSTLFDGRYERIAALGTGACGDAFFACHRGSRHEVVLKLLRARNQDDERRFVREADLLAHLDHPGIPRFYDHAPEAWPPYIAMARAPGVPAVRLCPPEAPRMKFVELAQVGIQLAEILKYLHARGILHRDLNANNVIIDLGREPRATLIDYGSAALTEKYYSLATPPRYWTPPEARVDIPDGGIEKLPWAAPEARTEGFSEKSDVYSLGFLLYRLITGKRPTKGYDGALDYLCTHHPTCPPDIAQAVLGALHPDPHSRLDAAQLAERLRDALPEDGTAPADAAPAASTAPANVEPVAPTAPPPPKPDPWDRSTRGWTQFMRATAEPGAQAVNAEPPGPPTENAEPPGTPAANAEPAPALAQVIPLHPRDILERATSLDPDFLPPPRSTRRPLWPVAVMAVMMLVGAVLLWSATGDPQDDVVSLPASPLEPQATAVTVKAIPALEERADRMPEVGPPAVMLTRANPELVACASRCGGTLWIELATTAGEPRFTSISVVCGGPGESTCARGVLDALRFTPPDSAHTLIEEVRP
ncbi:MAG: serine/threonine protein kinase [Myxococcales bacterium]|nr:serine/threonine protein kinase [Myxococcales bacterium]